MSQFYYTYALRSRKDGRLYIGWTNDLKKRVLSHNKSEVLTTKGRLPLDLVYYEGCINKKAAIRREKQLKTGFGRLYLKKRLV